MKRLLIFMIALPLGVNAQIDLQNLPWKNLPCDSLQTQLEMNFCSAKKIRMADSVMNMLYWTVLDSLKHRLENDIKKFGNDRDSEWAIDLQKKLIHSFEESQVNFGLYCGSIKVFISNQYYGGSMREQQVNIWALSLIEARIKTLMDLKENFIDH